MCEAPPPFFIFQKRFSGAKKRSGFFYNRGIYGKKGPKTEKRGEENSFSDQVTIRISLSFSLERRRRVDQFADSRDSVSSSSPPSFLLSSPKYLPICTLKWKERRGEKQMRSVWQ